MVDISFGLKEILFFNLKFVGFMIKEIFKVVFFLKFFLYRILNLWMIFRWIFIINIIVVNLRKFIKKYNIFV